LLLVLSCFAPATPIPAWLLQLPPLAALLADRAGQEKENGAERRGLRAGLQGLSRTGLIEIATSGGAAGVNAVTVHPVVADANRIRLAASADAEHAAVQGTAVALLEAATAGLDPARPGDWPTWPLLRPHVNAAIDLLADDLDPAVLARLLMVSAVGTEALLGAGRLAAAEKLARASVAAAAFLSRDDPAAMSARGYLARTLVRRGRSGDAETIYRELLAEHPDTLDTEHRLGWLVGRQGRYTEAIDIVNDVLGGRRNVLGADHPDTLAARETLAWLTGLRGKHPEAEELCREVLAGRRVLGDDHPDTLTTRGTLAWLTELRGRYAGAEQQYRDLLTDRQRILGPSHPDTLTARQDVARILGQQHRYAEAEQLSREVLADRRRLLGEDHPDTLTSRGTLARLASRQGRRAEAEELYRQVIADRTRVLGASHPDTAAVRSEFAQAAAP
jgi:tetratricopeptide (TPR) repeat protein